MAMESQQASLMFKMDGTKLPGTLQPFSTCMYASGKYIQLGTRSFHQVLFGSHVKICNLARRMKKQEYQKAESIDNKMKTEGQMLFYIFHAICKISNFNV